MLRPVMTGLISFSMIAAVTAQETKPEKPQKGPQTEQDEQRERAKKISEQDENSEGQREELPESFKSLNLTEQQKQEILSIYRESDAKAQQIWNRVQDLHRQAINMEACVIAAARLQNHDHSAHAAQGKENVNGEQHSAAADKPNQKKAQKRNQASSDRAQDKTTLTPKADDSDRSERERATSEQTEDRNPRTALTQHADRRDPYSGDRSDKSRDSAASGDNDELKIVSVRVGIAQPDGRIREVFIAQPAAQKGSEACEGCEAHQAQLLTVWKQIHEGHEQLVELEADTIVRVEAQLTEEQLQQMDKAIGQTAQNTN